MGRKHAQWRSGLFERAQNIVNILIKEDIFNAMANRLFTKTVKGFFVELFERLWQFVEGNGSEHGLVPAGRFGSEPSHPRPVIKPLFDGWEVAGFVAIPEPFNSPRATEER
jgi:hypothetical protein